MRARYIKCFVISQELKGQSPSREKRKDDTGHHPDLICINSGHVDSTRQEHGHFLNLPKITKADTSKTSQISGVKFIQHHVIIGLHLLGVIFMLFTCGGGGFVILLRKFKQDLWEAVSGYPNDHLSAPIDNIEWQCIQWRMNLWLFLCCLNQHWFLLLIIGIISDLFNFSLTYVHKTVSLIESTIHRRKLIFDVYCK